jgi:hypothetical protein
MKRIMTICCGIVLTALVAVGGVSAKEAGLTGSIRVKSDSEAALVGMAKISLDSALKEALKAVAGTVLSAELENENGYLVYAVEIAKADHQTMDVKVDAGNGKVLKVETDQKDRENGEKEDSDDGHEEEGER